jgi:hypothetical protein
MKTPSRLLACMMALGLGLVTSAAFPSGPQEESTRDPITVNWLPDNVILDPFGS